MYTGTMIDALIASVERAETHADPATEPLPVKVDVYATYTYEFTYDEALVGVA